MSRSAATAGAAALLLALVLTGCQGLAAPGADDAPTEPVQSTQRATDGTDRTLGTARRGPRASPTATASRTPAEDRPEDRPGGCAERRDTEGHGALHSQRHPSRTVHDLPLSTGTLEVTVACSHPSVPQPLH